MGQWVSLCQIINNRVNCHLIEIIEFCLKIYDLWRHTHLWVCVWVDGWVGYCVGQWVGSCQITRNSIIWKLIKIIQFCLKDFNSIAIGKFRLTIWNTSFWNFLVKFGHNGP